LRLPGIRGARGSSGFHQDLAGPGARGPQVTSLDIQARDSGTCAATVADILQSLRREKRLLERKTSAGGVFTCSQDVSPHAPQPGPQQPPAGGPLVQTNGALNMRRSLVEPIPLVLEAAESVFGNGARHDPQVRRRLEHCLQILRGPTQLA